jgi:ABC-2 type transport system permease protein
MNKFFILLSKELREMLTPQMIIPLVLSILLFNFIGRLAASAGHVESSPQFYVLNLDGGDFSNKVVATLCERGGVQPDFRGDIDLALEQTALSHTKTLVVLPAGLGEDAKAARPVKVQLYTSVQSFSMIAGLKSVQVRSVMAEVGYAVRKLAVAERAPGLDQNFLNSPAHVEEFVVVNGKRAQLGMSQVTAFVQSQSTFVPVILLMILVFASQTIVSSVASEKENKTFETLLSLPISRNAIVFAKLCAAALVALAFSGFFVFGFRSYMTNMAGGASSATGAMMAELAKLGVVMTAPAYLVLGISLFLSIMCALLLALILGIMADDVKSAQLVLTPLIMTILLPYLLVMLSDFSTITGLPKYLLLAIPFTHTFLMMQNIIFGNFGAVLAGIIYQGVIVIVLTAAATRMFSSESVLTLRLPAMFRR